MLLRRTAVTLAGLGLALTVGAAPAAAHEGHEGEEKMSPGQNKDVIPLHCEGVGDLTVEVTSANKGRGVGRIIEGGKGVLIPTVATFEVRNETTGEVLESEVEEFAPGQRKMRTTTCTAEFFRGTLADVAEFDPEFAEFLAGQGVAETDLIVAEASVEALLRGPIAKSRR
jgi:hypothetical protein